MSDTIKNKSTKKRRGLWWKVPLGGLLFLLLTFAAFRFVVYQRVQNRLNAIRDAGYPVSLEEHDAWYVYPQGTNAADVYLQAFSAYVGNKDFEYTLPVLGDRETLPGPGESLPKDVADRIAYYLQQNADAITKLDEAATIESCRFPIDLTQGIGTLLPHLGSVRNSARIRVLQSALNESRGDSDAAASSCLKIFALTNAIKNEPILISALVNQSMQKIAHEELKRLIVNGGLSDQSIGLIQRAILANDNHRLMHRAFIGERCMGEGLFLNVEQLDLNAKLNPVFVLTWLIGLMDLDNAYYLDQMGAYINVVQVITWPLPDEYVDNEYDIPRLYLVSGIVMPALDNCIVNSIETIAQQQVLLAGIGIEQYRRATGELPETLEVLTPRYMDHVPIDPFTGQPLKYRYEHDGAVVYSIGQDGQDNGGNPSGYTWLRDAGKNGTDIALVFGSIVERTVASGTGQLNLTDFPILDEDALEDEDKAWYQDDHHNRRGLPGLFA